MQDWRRGLSLSLAVAWMVIHSANVFAADAASAAAAASRLEESILYLADDALEGRGVGTKGLAVAADYVAEQFAAAGLNTEIIDGKPFQYFNVTAKTELGDKAKNHLTLVGPAGKRIELKIGETFTPLAIGGTGVLDQPLVLVGYGISADDLEYDDYAEVDVNGKVAVIIRKEPQQKDKQSKFNGTDTTDHATFRRKVDNAVKHGAVAVIIVNDRPQLQKDAAAERKKWADAMRRMNALYARFRALKNPTPAQLAKHTKDSEKLSRAVAASVKRLQTKDFDRILGYQEAGVGERKSPPVFFVARKEMDRVVQSVLKTDLDALEQDIDVDLKPRSRELVGWEAVGETEIKTTRDDIKNVIGVLEGAGPLAQETVIVGAHYDHIGMGGRGALAPWTVAVHNGADDNASGTSVLLEVARRMAGRSGKPRRRVVFIAFTGEERGLLGSAHYVKHPLFPLEQTVAMINMDMVGRLKDNKLVVYGTGTAKEFDGLVDRLNKTHQFEITKKPTGYGPSDHASFYPRKIPVFHLFTGTHSDYHRPSDDADKINIEGMRRVADFATELVESIVDAEQRPTYVTAKRNAVVRRTSNRPYLGVIPDLDSKRQGFVIQGVVDGPAKTAGMIAGDAIIRFDKHKIDNFDDIDQALRKRQPGDKVQIVLLRDGQELQLEVVLAPPR